MIFSHSFALVVLASLLVVSDAGKGMMMKMTKGKGNMRKAPKFYELRPQTCSPFPQQGDSVAVANPDAPFTVVGDRFIFSRQVYAVAKSECDISSPLGIELNGVCTTTRAASATAGPLLYCTGILTEKDSSTLTLSFNSVLGGTEDESYLGVITGGTGKYAGLNGYIRQDVVRVDVANNIGIDYTSFYAAYF